MLSVIFNRSFICWNKAVVQLKCLKMIKGFRKTPKRNLVSEDQTVIATWGAGRSRFCVFAVVRETSRAPWSLPFQSALIFALLNEANDPQISNGNSRQAKSGLFFPYCFPAMCSTGLTMDVSWVLGAACVRGKGQTTQVPKFHRRVGPASDLWVFWGRTLP